MSLFYSPVIQVATEYADIEPPPTQQSSTNLIALEFGYLLRGQLSSFRSEMALIEVVINKARDARNTREQFSNRYLLAGNLAYNAPAVETAARAIALAESRIYPTSIVFMRAIMRTLTDEGKPVKYQSRSVALDMGGLYIVPPGDVIAADNVVLAVEKEAIVGRPGVSFYRHAVTSEEEAAWQQDRLIADRLIAANDPGGLPMSTFAAALMVAVDGDTLRYALPDNPNDLVNGPRFITQFKVAGIRMNDPSRPKQAAWAKRVEGAQAEISRLGREARRVKGAGWPDPPAGFIVGIATALRQDAMEIWSSLPADLRARIIWPDIFNDVRIIAGQ